jgi:hypothetical protein
MIAAERSCFASDSFAAVTRFSGLSPHPLISMAADIVHAKAAIFSGRLFISILCRAKFRTTAI